MVGAATVLLVGTDPAFVAREALRDHCPSVDVVTTTDTGSVPERCATGVDCVVAADLPVTDGLALHEDVADVDPDLPFVLVTDEGTDAAERAIAAGVTDVVRRTGDGLPGAVFARRVENAVEARRTARALDSRERAFERMVETLGGDGSFSDELPALLDVCRRALGVEHGALVRVTDGTCTVVAAAGPDVVAPDPGESARLDGTLSRAVVEDGDTRSVADATADRPESTDVAAHAERFDCVVETPVTVDGIDFGTLRFADRSPRGRSFDRWERSLVELVAGWVGAELSRQRDATTLRREREQLDDFATAVAHDLRTPLNVLSASLTLVRERGDPEDIDRAEATVDRLDRIVEDLRLLATFDRRENDLQPIPLEPEVRRVWGALAPSTADLTVVDDLGEVTATPRGIQTLLERLLENAIDHAGDDVHVEVGLLDGPGFYVADDGPGIPLERQSSVFDHGFSTKTGGTGLGLTIASRVAVAHGWHLDVATSQPADAGARFDVDTEGGVAVDGIETGIVDPRSVEPTPGHAGRVPEESPSEGRDD